MANSELKESEVRKFLDVRLDSENMSVPYVKKAVNES